MKNTISRTVALLAAAVALGLFGGTALANSTTGAIISDVATDGHVDGHYSVAQLKAALKSPLLAQYGGQGGVAGVQGAIGGKKAKPATKPTKTKTTPANTAPAATKPKAAVAAAPPAESGNLPFTGADVGLFLIVGGALVGTGIVLRRLGRSGADL
jgi:hypothetical protein